MATIAEIKTSVDQNIRQKTLPGSITKTNHAAIEDALADEILARGVVQAASVSSLSSHSRLNTQLVFVHNVGLFVPYESAEAEDEDTTFESADSGWLWRKVLDVSAQDGAVGFTITGDETWTLKDGWMVDKIMVKPSVEEEAAKIGTTNGGDEIMYQDKLLEGKWRSVNMDVFADEGDVTIYFSGFTATTYVMIYKRKLWYDS